MTLGIGDPKRDVVPRWRASASSALDGSLNSVVANTGCASNEGYFQDALSTWLENRRYIYAAELISCAYTYRRVQDAEVLRAAELVLKDSREDELAKEIAGAILGGAADAGVNDSLLSSNEQRSQYQSQIAALRRRVHLMPHNAIAYVDIARLYAILGQKRQARENMEKAIILAPGNRFVLRSGSRLYIHLDESERAHALLAGSPLTKVDPWVLAAEIATANARRVRSGFIKRAKQLIDSGRFADRQVSELCSAVGSHELLNGSRLKSKRHFDASLVNPTENSVAQAYWADRQFDLRLNAIADTGGLALSAEANAWSQYISENWRQAVSASATWLADQPFSRRPALHGAWVSWFGVDDIDAAMRFTEAGLCANPDDFLLLNNYVYYSILLGNTAKAQTVAGRIAGRRLSDQDSVVWEATKGLLKIRTGEVNEGRILYHSAIEKAMKMRDQYRAAIAAINLAREESILGSSEARRVLEFARFLCEHAKGPSIRPCLARVERLVQMASQRPMDLVVDKPLSPLLFDKMGYKASR